MTQDDIKYEVATLLTARRCSYNEIARRLGLTESRVSAIIRDLYASNHTCFLTFKLCC